MYCTHWETSLFEGVLENQFPEAWLPSVTENNAVKDVTYSVRLHTIESNDSVLEELEAQVPWVCYVQIMFTYFSTAHTTSCLYSLTIFSCLSPEFWNHVPRLDPKRPHRSSAPHPSYPEGF